MSYQAGTDVPSSIHGVSFIYRRYIPAQVEDILWLKFLFSAKAPVISFSSSSETLQFFQITLSGKLRRVGLATHPARGRHISNIFLYIDRIF